MDPALAYWSSIVVLPILLLLAIPFVAIVFEVFMFLDIIKNDKLSDNEKILWVLGLWILPVILALVYYFVAHSRLSPRKNSKP